MEFFLSGHGGSSSATSYTLPGELITYCPMGDVLDIKSSWKVFDALTAGDLAAAAALQHTVYSPGDSIEMLTLYPSTDFTSGIFEVGAGKIALRSLDGGQFTIKDFFTFYRNQATTVHWIACLN